MNWKWKKTLLDAAAALPRRFTTEAAASRRSFRSDAALEAIARAKDDRVPNLVLYNYPSFSGAFSALFAHLLHSKLNLPVLILPFSSVEPLRLEDIYLEGLEHCYLLDFLGPNGFAENLSLRSHCKIFAFDHRKSVVSRISPEKICPENLTILFDTEKSSSVAAYKYFSQKLADNKSKEDDDMVESLLPPTDRDRVEMVLNYIEDVDLRRWSLSDTKAFNLGLSEFRSKLNCLTNPYMYEQLSGLSSADLIEKGNSSIRSKQDSAANFLDKAFVVQLGRGLYGACLGVRVDGSSDLSDEICKQLSVKSAALGLRPIGAVIYMQRKNLKMCLRSVDDVTDTSEIAKAYGGGGTPSSSSFIIRMDEYNWWLSVRFHHLGHLGDERKEELLHQLTRDKNFGVVA